MFFRYAVHRRKLARLSRCKGHQDCNNDQLHHSATQERQLVDELDVEISLSIGWIKSKYKIKIWNKNILFLSLMTASSSPTIARTLKNMLWLLTKRRICEALRVMPYFQFFNFSTYHLPIFSFHSFFLSINCVPHLLDWKFTWKVACFVL